MASNDKTTTPSSRPTSVQEGYKPKLVTGGYKPKPQSGNQLAVTTGQATPAKPPSNPPNQGSGGKK